MPSIIYEFVFAVLQFIPHFVLPLIYSSVLHSATFALSCVLDPNGGGSALADLWWLSSSFFMVVVTSCSHLTLAAGSNRDVHLVVW